MLKFLSTPRKGAALSILAFITLMSIFAGFALFNYSVREYQLEETRQVMRDLGETVNAIHSHYSNFIEIAGEYIDDYNEASPQNMGDVVSAWGGQGLFSLPVGEETLESIVDRLSLDDYMTHTPFDGRSIEDVSFKSEIQTYITSPVGLSMVPSRWTVTITVNSKGKGTFSTGLLRERSAKENGFLSPLHKNQYISVNIIKMERDEIIIMLDCRLVSRSSFSYGSYEM